MILDLMLPKSDLASEVFGAGRISRRQSDAVLLISRSSRRATLEADRNVGLEIIGADALPTR